MVSFDKKNLHHAYLCTGDREQIKESVLSFIEDDLKINTVGNPDVRVEDYSNFGINDARSINKAQLKKSVSGEKMIFVISFDSITTEAQNSLLKMFEEPTEDTHFFVITTTSEIFLPTLLSRMEKKAHKSVTDEDTKKLTEKFLKSTKADRIVLLKEIIDEKDKAGALKLLNSLERTIYEKEGTKAVSSYEAINLCRKYINDRGASVKMLMEYLAINV